MPSKYLVECLNCSIHMLVIWSSSLVLYLELLGHHSDFCIDEMSTLIAHQYIKTSKLDNHIVEKEPYCYHGCTILTWCYLSPSHEIISRSDEIS